MKKSCLKQHYFLAYSAKKILPEQDFFCAIRQIKLSRF